ncbi:MAG: ethylbenzene dehydrogenase-related protein [Acidiferrobacterales bacterium]
MNPVYQRSVLVAVAALFAMGLSVPAVAAPPSDWSTIPTKSIKLFYPGQSTYQWLRTREHKRADKKTRAGEACIECHEGEEEEIGAKIAAGERLEPANLSGKQGTIDLNVQVAYDAKNIYWRFRWKTKNNFPGRAHPHLRYDGKEWKTYGYPRLHKLVQTGKQPALYEDRLSMMIDDGTVPMFKEQGCWLTCHDGQRDMPRKASKDQVKAHPLLGKVLKKKDVRKYLPVSRSDENVSWDKTKSADEIAKIKAAGGFVDLMQWRAHRSNIVGMSDDGYVLEYRLFDAGKKMFSSNENKKAHQPKFMYNKNKVAVMSVTADTVRDVSMPYALVRERNAVSFDPNAGWKPGDMVPRYVLTREGTSGSAADNNNTKGEWKNGMWTVLWTRPLNTSHTEDDKILKEGGVYSIGFAVHDDNITTRGHHVSFPFTLGVGTKADIEATKVN